MFCVKSQASFISVYGRFGLLCVYSNIFGVDYHTIHLSSCKHIIFVLPNFLICNFHNTHSTFSLFVLGMAIFGCELGSRSNESKAFIFNEFALKYQFTVEGC
jgi:hypothetical protein